MTGDGRIFSASYARGVSAVSVFDAFSAQKCRGRFGLNRESRLRTAFGFSDSGRIEYYRGDRKAVSNATSRLRLAPLKDVGNFLPSGGTDSAVLKKEKTEGLPQEGRRQFIPTGLTFAFFFPGADLPGVATTKNI